MWPLTQSYWRLEWTVLFGECQAPVDECDDCSDVPVTNVQFDMERFVADSNVTMHYVDLIVNDDNGETVEVQGSFDTGTQMSVIKEDLINPLQYEVLSEVKLLGFNDNMSTGKVISLFAKLNDQDLSVPIKFVACQHVTQNCLLSLADYVHCYKIRRYVLLGGRPWGLLKTRTIYRQALVTCSRYLMRRVMTSTLVSPQLLC